MPHPCPHTHAHNLVPRVSLSLLRETLGTRLTRTRFEKKDAKFICILSVSLDFFPDLLFYTKIAFRFLEKETLGIAVLQSNGVTNIITVFKSYQHVSRTFLESN